MHQFYIQYEYAMAATQLVLAMLGIGLTLTPGDFRRIFLYPRSLGLGMAIQMLLAPALAYITLKSGSVPLGVATGLVLCATAPGGSASNIFTHIARGNTGLSVSLTALTSLICMLSIPFFLGLMLNGGHTLNLEIPVLRIGQEIGGFLLLPLLIGMLLLKWLPRQAPTLSKLCIRVSLAIIVLMIATALTSGRMDLKLFGASNIIIVIGFMLTHIIGGILLMKFLRIPNGDLTAIAIETAVRNGSLALMIKASLIPSESVTGVDYVLFTVMLYTGMQSLFALTLIALGRRTNAQTSFVTASSAATGAVQTAALR